MANWFCSAAAGKARALTRDMAEDWENAMSTLKAVSKMLWVMVLAIGLAGTPAMSAMGKSGGGGSGKGGSGKGGGSNNDDSNLADLMRGKKGGVGFGIRPGVVPSFSYMDGAGNTPLGIAVGFRGVYTIADYTRAGGEVFYDFGTGTIAGGAMVEGAIPIRKRIDVGVGGVAGYGNWGLFLEPRVSIHLEYKKVAIEGSLSYQLHTGDPGTWGDGTNLHMGTTYIMFSMLFGNW